MVKKSSGLLRKTELIIEWKSMILHKENRSKREKKRIKVKFKSEFLKGQNRNKRKLAAMAIE
ncbi:hypothetical protein [Fusibacter bizertensis]